MPEVPRGAALQGRQITRWRSVSLFSEVELGAALCVVWRLPAVAAVEVVQEEVRQVVVV